VNKDFTIPEEDYKIYVPKSKQVPLSNSDLKNKKNSSRKAPAIILQASKSKESTISMGSHDGIIIKKSEHLSSFAIDKDKIDFYK